ncbi:PLP-dependent aminotransferase family protein [[Flexibacter] sp. ATCC 35208]|uniref:aminotransferase-like domain-containing protein n=1 Tax=[Flexibacter] sp. ATCC 35208 TaxID=1936242 RepID=UPI0009D58995|nr:PLP-dependent aminotransferase family protein [[Flexibacter] sp. ATCC 35208]OMP79414.1 GntR family transcriptional regulator [[Flexibacter] sp. ATCC 35208]
MLKTADHLYLQIAENVEQLIIKQVLKTGDKLPSVRNMSEEQGVSMSTAFQAYYHLESKGMIESRPKSGYYVTYSPRRMPELPKQTEAVKKPSEVTVHEMISRMYLHGSNPEILKFSSAVFPVAQLPAAKMTKAMVQAIHRLPNGGLGYDSPQGNEDLRRQIARMSIGWGGAVTEDDSVIAAGCSDAISLCLSATTQPGDTIAVESPTYYGFLQLAENLGLKVLEIPTHPLTGVDLDYLDKAIPKFKVKACLFVTNFTNPLGACMPDSHKQELVRILEKYDIPLIEDDIYGDMYFGKERPGLCKTFDKNGLVLLCNSFSKSLAPGYRVGWALPGRYKEKVLRIKRNRAISSPSLPSAAIACFLENGRYEHHLRGMRKILHTQFMRHLQAISDYFPEDTCVTRPGGGFVCWIELNPKINTFELYEQSLKHKVIFAPGRIFSLQDRYTNCLRISYSNPWSKTVEDGLKTVGRLARKLMS